MSTLYRVVVSYKRTLSDPEVKLGSALYAVNDFGPLEVKRRTFSFDNLVAAELFPDCSELLELAAKVSADNAVPKYFDSKRAIAWNIETGIVTEVQSTPMPDPGPKVQAKARKSGGGRAWLNHGR